MRIFSFALSFLFEAIKSTDAHDQHQSNYECSKLQPSNTVDFDSISIPPYFMDYTNNHVIHEIFESYADLFDFKHKSTKATPSSATENMSTKELISSIKIFIDKHFSSQKDNYPYEIYQVKSIIYEIYNKSSVIDFTILNKVASNIFKKKLKISLLNMLKQLKLCVKSKNFSYVSNSIDTSRLILLSYLLSESKSCLAIFSEFSIEYDKIKNNIAKIKESYLKTATKSINSNQLNELPGNHKKSSEIVNISNVFRTSEDYFSLPTSLNHLFTCNVPLEKSNWLVKSFCKSNTGVWYFAITASDLGHFYILKIDQKNFNIADSSYELIENYSFISKKGFEKVNFNTFCRKILINSSGILYVLKFSKSYMSFEVLALDSDFNLIKKLELNSFKDNGFKDSFIEDIEIYSDLLYMLDSKNKCIIVTDFDFNVKRIINVDIEFEKFKEYTKSALKTKTSLIVTEEIIYVLFKGNFYTFKNSVKSIEDSNIQITEKKSKIELQHISDFSSFESMIYIGNDNFISYPNHFNQYLTFSKLFSTDTPPKFESQILYINLALRGKRISFELKAMEDHTVYAVEGGPNIRFYKFDNKSSSKTNQ